MYALVGVPEAEFDSSPRSLREDGIVHSGITILDHQRLSTSLQHART